MNTNVIGDDRNAKDWESAYMKIKAEIQTLQDKLRRKQECLIQVQTEKENQYVELGYVIKNSVTTILRYFTNNISTHIEIS